jgi:hypothetical protein
MIGRDSRDDLYAYGLWPWIGGLVLAGFIILIMFQFARSIS